jgi:hypothetical protein
MISRSYALITMGSVHNIIVLIKVKHGRCTFKKIQKLQRKKLMFPDQDCQ